MAATTAKRTWNANPWLALDLDRVRMYDRGIEKAYGIRATLAEYREHTTSRPCRCGRRLWFRVTVGAWQCPSCRALQTEAGAYID